MFSPCRRPASRSPPPSVPQSPPKKRRKRLTNWDTMRGTLDILFRIMAQCDLEDLARMAKTCKLFAAAAHEERSHRVKCIFEPFVDDQDSFNTMLYDTQSAITGWAAVKALHPTAPPPSDLDIATCYGMAEAVGTHIRALGYVKVDEDTLDPQRRALHNGLFFHETCLVQSITTFVRPHDGRRIEILQSRTASAVDVVLSHPNSLMQNCITSEFIVSFYPWYTFKNKAVSTREDTANKAYGTQLNKYMKRGFDVHINNRFTVGPCGSTCPLVRHDISDPLLCIARYSPFRPQDVQGELPPAARRDWFIEMDLRLGYRLGHICANVACERRNT